MINQFDVFKLKQGIWIIKSKYPVNIVNNALPSINGMIYYYRVYNYSHGEKHGEYKKYRMPADIELETFYKSIDSYKPMEIGWYEYGSLEGDLKVFFDNSEILLAKVPYKDGKRHGLWVRYNKEGEIIKAGNYINGERNGYFLLESYSTEDIANNGVIVKKEEVFYL